MFPWSHVILKVYALPTRPWNPRIPIVEIRSRNPDFWCPFWVINRVSCPHERKKSGIPCSCWDAMCLFFSGCYTGVGNSPPFVPKRGMLPTPGRRPLRVFSTDKDAFQNTDVACFMAKIPEWCQYDMQSSIETFRNEKWFKGHILCDR